MADPAAQRWHTVFQNAMLRRVTAADLAIPLKQLSMERSTSGAMIASVLLDLRARRGVVDDPLLFHYIQLVLESSYASTGDVLLALLKQSRVMEKAGDANGEETSVRLTGMPTCEERMFTLLAQLHLNGSLSLTSSEMHQTLNALVRWLRAAHEHEYGKQLRSAGLPTLDPLTCGMYDALGSLALAILGKHSFRSVAEQKWWQQRRPLVVQEMLSYDMHVLQCMQSQLSGRMQALTKLPPFLESDADGRPVINGQQILESVTELPIAQTRAGLYIWLSACLCGRPLTDDATMLGYLQTRYNGDNQTLAVHLLVASFDVLTNAHLRSDSPQRIKLIRSFLCNKVPSLLAIMAAFLAPMTAEQCIQMAFTDISMDALPPLEAGSAKVREKLVEARLAFFQACALHHLVSEASISSITQESVRLPKIPRFTKEGLANQCNSNVSQLESFLIHPSMMQGNAGAIAGCVVEVINNLCMNKDSMSLKTLCNVLIRHIEEMEIVLQYAQPADLLQPLCTLLNDWVHDQEQSEFTPAYEEFASILLLTLGIIYRYGISQVEVGLASNGNFVFELVGDISSSIPRSELSEEQSAQLSKWTEGLFATDEQGETSGISDEVMRQCPPQAFYKLVPTLFEQSALACKSGVLSVDALKGGLELLLEPFLLPSLVGGLAWVVKHSWEDHGDTDILLHLLEKFLRPSSSSQEVQAMHSVILDMIAPPLVRSLQELSRKRPDKKAAIGLIELLQPHVVQRQTMHAYAAELHEWAATSDGALTRAVRNNVRDLVSWASSVGPNPPTRYSHRTFLAVCQLLGQERVLQALAAEVQEHTAAGLGSQALDVCVALVCAPSTPAITSIANVRDSLRQTVLDTRSLLKKPATRAEALVRLSRRVEAQLTVPQIQQLPFALPVQEQSTDQIMQELGLAEPDAGHDANANTSLGQPSDMSQVSTADFSNTDLSSALGPAIDFNNPSVQKMPDDQNAMSTDDIFGDLDLSLDAGGPQLDFQQSGIPGDANSSNQKDDDIFADIMGDMNADFDF